MSSLLFSHEVVSKSDSWAVACQDFLSFTISWNLLKCMSIESVMLSNYLILWHPLLLLPSVFPSIRVFSSESVLCIRWPKYWSLSFSIGPSNEYLRLISFRMDWLISLQSKGFSRVFSITTVQKHQFFGTLLSLASLATQRLKRLLPMRETKVRSLGREDPLEKEVVTHPSTLAWRIPWTEKPGRLQSMGSQGVGHG